MTTKLRRAGRSRPRLALAAVALALASAGCGGEARERFPVSGSVNYQGKPVAMGSIRFEADASVGDFAPVTHAQIVDGKFATKPDISPAAGTYRVQVMGIDKDRIKEGPPGTAPDMPALFPPYQTTVQIPPPGGVLDIEVPSKNDAGK
jgi:hypothetical protein